jgi:hypothetical protein
LFHRFDIVLEPPGRTSGAELADCVYQDRYGGIARCHSMNAGDKSASIVSVADADRTRFAANTYAADIDIVIARDSKTCIKAQGYIVAAGGVAPERSKTIGRVFSAYSVAKKRKSSICCVECARGIAKESLIARGRVVAARRVAKKSKRSIGRVIGSSRIAQERPGASGRVLIGCVEKERPGTHTRVEVAVGEGCERKQTNSRIVKATREAQESALPFRRVAPGITAIRRWIYRLRILDKRKAGEREHRERGTKNFRFDFHMFLPFIIVLEKLRTECVRQ